MERCLMRLEWGVVLGGRVADEAGEGGSGLLCPTGAVRGEAWCAQCVTHSFYCLILQRAFWFLSFLSFCGSDSLCPQVLTQESL